MDDSEREVPVIRPPRVAEWRSLLNTHIEANRSTIHSYNKSEGLDCARWADSCKLVVIGKSYPIITKAKYKTAAGAMSYIQSQGCTTVDELADKILGARQPISFAGAGDIVLADLAKLQLTGNLPQMGLALGICNGAVSYFTSDEGLISLRTLDLEACYYG